MLRGSISTFVIGQILPAFACAVQVCYFLLCMLRRTEKYFRSTTFVLVTQLLSADIAIASCV